MSKTASGKIVLLFFLLAAGVPLPAFAQQPAEPGYLQGAGEAGVLKVELLAGGGAVRSWRLYGKLVHNDRLGWFFYQDGRMVRILGDDGSITVHPDNGSAPPLTPRKAKGERGFRITQYLDEGLVQAWHIDSLDEVRAGDAGAWVSDRRPSWQIVGSRGVVQIYGPAVMEEL